MLGVIAVNQTRFLLPLPTNRTHRGPEFQKIGNTIVIQYDCEQDDGVLKNTELVFEEVLDFEFRQAVCLVVEDLLPFTQMLCLRKSDRLSAILELWRKSVGWQEFQTRNGGEERFRHYKLYFDNAGGLDIIASGFQPALTPVVSSD
jgi:hypothetical protein